uniref:Uncharacterized protein n=1 Tax=Zea mays TaxID=4577 RepID=B7ZY22_MAIZE|nr:unknown [Zea mays]|eukprot:NP_001159104.1 uncharacterized protein LOC100275099 [Zea mays]
MALGFSSSVGMSLPPSSAVSLDLPMNCLFLFLPLRNHGTEKTRPKKALWLDLDAEMRKRRGELGPCSLTSARRSGRGRRPLAGVRVGAGAPLLRRCSRPTAVQHRFRLRFSCLNIKHTNM